MTPLTTERASVLPGYRRALRGNVLEAETVVDDEHGGEGHRTGRDERVEQTDRGDRDGRNVVPEQQARRRGSGLDRASQASTRADVRDRIALGLPASNPIGALLCSLVERTVWRVVPCDAQR